MLGHRFYAASHWYALESFLSYLKEVDYLRLFGYDLYTQLKVDRSWVHFCLVLVPVNLACKLYFLESGPSFSKTGIM